MSDDVEAKGKRSYSSQREYPRHTLADALRVASVIADHYAGEPAEPLDVAASLNMQPTTGHFRSLTGAAVAYGLTTGGPNASLIGLTDLGQRIVMPTEEGEDEPAKREALVRPRVSREFLTKYDGRKLPPTDIAKNVLLKLGVPAASTEKTLAFILESADQAGALQDIKGEKFVRLRGATRASGAAATTSEADVSAEEGSDEGGVGDATSFVEFKEEAPEIVPATVVVNRRVFITHGKDKGIAQQLKELLTFGQFEPVMSVERETVAKPVPDKVLDDMRSCGAAIIHVGSETKAIDPDGNALVVLNPNVMIEIGAAMALYKRQFILLVQEGVALPSNLQGLYEVRYEGDKLDYEATMKLLKAFNDFKAES